MPASSALIRKRGVKKVYDDLLCLARVLGFVLGFMLAWAFDMWRNGGDLFD